MKLSPRYDGPPILLIDDQDDDRGVAVCRQRRRLASLLSELGEDDWRAASRCDGWTVQDVVAHLVGVNAFWEMSVRAGIAGSPTQVLAAFDPAAHPPMMIEPMRALSYSDVLDQFVASNEGFLGALESLHDDGWSLSAESPAGHVPIRLVAHHALWDSWIHERDIALPLGRTQPQEPDEIGIALRYAAAVGPALTIGDDDAFSGALAVVATEPDDCFILEVADSVTVRDATPTAGTPCLRGAAVDLIEGLSIRAPLPADTPTEWHRLVHGLATVFDTDLAPSS